MNILIVDDEKPCRIVLKNYLRANSFVKRIDEANNVDEAVTAINTISPDVVFLDIQLRNETGFDILDKIQQQNFQLVFVTSYDNYAIKAFDYAALHYLLKPVGRLDINQALIRCKESDHKIEAKKIEEVRHLYLRTEDKAFNIDLSSVTYLEAEGSYTRIHFLDRKSIFSAKNIGVIEKQLSASFYRIHRSIIVNTNMVTEVNRKDNTVNLKNNTTLPISRRKKKDFKLILQGM